MSSKTRLFFLDALALVSIGFFATTVPRGEATPPKHSSLTNLEPKSALVNSTQADDHATHPKARPVVQETRMLSVPTEYRFGSTASVPAVRNWHELVATLPSEDRDAAQLLAATYPEAYEFQSTDQLKWMVENGFPSPSEYIEAQNMPEAELLRMAEGGNKKAAMLALDRLLTQSVALGRNDPDATKRDLTIARLESFAKQTSCSPFSLHQRARHSEIASKQRSSQALRESALRQMAAEFAVASALGDWRVDETTRAAASGMTWTPKSSIEFSQQVLTAKSLMPTGCRPTPLPRN